GGGAHHGFCDARDVRSTLLGGGAGVGLRADCSRTTWRALLAASALVPSGPPRFPRAIAGPAACDARHLEFAHRDQSAASALPGRPAPWSTHRSAWFGSLRVGPSGQTWQSTS